MRYETFDEFVYSKTIIKLGLMISLCKNDRCCSYHNLLYIATCENNCVLDS